MSGTPVTILGLPGVTPDTTDLIPTWDTSAGLTGRFGVAALATMYAALTGASFTGTVQVSGQLDAFKANPFDNGTGMGARLYLGKNSNATAAPAYMSLMLASSSLCHIWPDDSGIWRTSIGASPNSSNYPTAGSVVGAQSSSLDVKDVVGDALPPEEVLALIAQGAAAVQRFVYKGTPYLDDDGNIHTTPPPYGGEEFSGVIVDYAGRYGTDRDSAHPNGKSLNTINAIGDLLIAVDYLAGRVLELETRLQTAVDAIETALTNFEANPGTT